MKPIFRFSLCLGVLCVLPVLSLAQSGKKERIEGHSQAVQKFLAANRPDLAMSELSAIVALDPANADARANLGVLQFFQGDFAKAAPDLRAAVKLQPSLWRVRALLGMCEKRLGDAVSARVHLEKSFPKLAEEKLRLQVGLELVEISYQAGDLDSAAATIGALRKLKPEDADILYTAHRIHSDLADEAMLGLAMAAPKSARALQLTGDRLAKNGDMKGAGERYRQALRIEPTLPGLHFQLAESLLASDMPSEREQAKNEYLAALVENPLDAKVECRLGEIALQKSDPDAAFTHYTRAVQLKPGDAAANLGYAKLLMARGEIKNAETSLLRAVRTEPFNATIRYRLATVYRQQGRTVDAQRETAEFQRLRQAKDELKELYRDMRLPLKNDEKE